MLVNKKNLCAHCFEGLSDNVAFCEFCGNSVDNNEQQTSNLPAGTILLGKFIIGKLLGKGGFGVTYLAYDLIRECKVAIKEYMPDTLSYRTPGNTLVSTYLGEKEESFKLGAEKFYEEAKTVSKFNGHPNIINVSEFFYENNTAYFVMEYIDGMDLKTYVMQKGGKISEEESITLLSPIMDALIIVHSIGILHRDISPDNIYITKDGDVKLLDFGAARQVMGEKSKSLSVVLKPGFAPMEQYQSRGNQGPWTDVYALAATMYYSLVGQVPEAAMDRIDNDNLKSPAELGVNVQPKMEKILSKALSLRAADRYQSMGEFKQAVINGEISTPSNDKILVEKPEVGIIKPTLKSGKLIISLATAGVIFVLACIGFAIWQNSLNDSTEVYGNGSSQNLAASSRNDTATKNSVTSSSNDSATMNSVTSSSNENAAASSSNENAAASSSNSNVAQNSAASSSDEKAAQNTSEISSSESTTSENTKSANSSDKNESKTTITPTKTEDTAK
ncbi:MAG: serine/threonine protein kinase, partial [Ruminiclostridium sp.]